VHNTRPEPNARWSSSQSGIEILEVRSLGEVVAERRYELDGIENRVVVQVGKPAPTPGGISHYCPYVIRGIGSGAIRHAEGIDGLQALQLALKMLAADLDTSPEARAGRLTLDGSRLLGGGS
jgi:hypothetical protein